MGAEQRVSRVLPRPVAPGHTTAHDGRGNMKTVSTTKDEPWLDDQRLRQLVAEDRAGYETHPIRPDEFEGLIAAQAIEMPEPPAPESGDD